MIQFTNTFYLPDSAVQMARDMQANDPDTYGNVYGGNNALFDPSNPANYETQGELAQNVDLAYVASQFIADPQGAIQWQQDNGYDYPAENNPAIRVPRWTPNGDWSDCYDQMKLGASFPDVMAALAQGGYSAGEGRDLFAKNVDDEFCQIAMPSGIGSNGILAQILKVPYAWRVLPTDPVLYFDPSTGLILDLSDPNQLAKAEWENHLGGENCNLALPVSDLSNFGGLSYLNSTFWGFFQSASYVQPLGAGFLKLGQKCMALGQQLFGYIKAQDPAITYNFNDLCSPVPLTPSQKQFLSSSKFYNPKGLHPPCLSTAAIYDTMSGNLPLVLSTDPNADPIINSQTGETVPSQLAKNKNWFPGVLKTWAHMILDYDAAQPPGRDGMEQSLLRPFAEAYQ